MRATVDFIVTLVLTGASIAAFYLCAWLVLDVFKRNDR